MYIVKRIFGGAKDKKCHKHSYNETCGIYWFFKRANNDKTTIILLFLLSLLIVKQNFKIWLKQTL